MGCGCNKSGVRNVSGGRGTSGPRSVRSGPPIKFSLLPPRPERSPSGLDAERRKVIKQRRDALRRLGKA